MRTPPDDLISDMKYNGIRSKSKSKSKSKIISQSKPVVDVLPIDKYIGEDIPKNKKSITYRIVFQSNIKTLDAAEIDKIQSNIIKSLNEKLNIVERYSI